MREAAPAAPETIKYNIPANELDGFLVSFAAGKKHLGLYPAPDGDESFNSRLAPYRTEKSTVRFPRNRPIPYHIIGELVRLRVEDRRQTSRGKSTG